MADNYRQIYTYIFYSVGIGVLIGGIYDIFRMIRMVFTLPGIISDERREGRHRSRLCVDFIVFLCDLLFFLAAAVVSAIFIFYVNNGRIRGIALFGSLLGFIAYYNSIGRLVSLISGSIIRGIYRVIFFIRKRILLPIFKATVFIFKYCIGKLILCREILYTRRRCRAVIKRFKKKGMLNCDQN